MKASVAKPMDRRFVTILFECDIRNMPNPFKMETPFGTAKVVAVGDVFAERDALEERVRELEMRAA